MQVGKLIELLQEFQGRGDAVTMYNGGENLNITAVGWDPDTQTVAIRTEPVRAYYPEMHVSINAICGVPDCRDSHPGGEE